MATQTQNQAQSAAVSIVHRFFYKLNGAVYHGCSVQQPDGSFKRSEQAPQMTATEIKALMAKITRRDGTPYNGRPETVYGLSGKQIVTGNVAYLVPDRLFEHFQQILEADRAGRQPSDLWLRPDQELTDAAIDPNALLFGTAAQAAQESTQPQPQARPQRRRTAQQVFG